MNGKTYSRLGCVAALLWPVTTISVIALREYLGGYGPLEHFLKKYPACDHALIGAVVASFGLSPVLLITGLFRAKEETTRAWVPFAVSLLAQAAGSAALMIYLKSALHRPLVAVLGYLAAYATAFFIWRRRQPDRTPVPAR